MNIVAALCHRFPEAALVARRFLDKSGKRAAETKPRKGHAFDPTKLVQYPVSYTHLTLPTICSV